MDSGKIWKILFILLIIGLVPFSASVSEVDVLVVDDGHNLTNYDEVNYEEGMFRDDYLKSLNSIEGVDAELETTDFGSDGDLGPPVNVLKQYDAVVWYTLSDRDTNDLDNIEETLKSADQERISSYLRGHGGSFFLTGHRISYDISAAQSEDMDFYRDYLGVESNPGSYFRGKIRDDGTFKGGSFDEIQLRNMTYDENDNLVLDTTDTGIFESGDVYRINTTVEPFDDFRTVSDKCDNRFDDESELGCPSKQESLRWMNNRPLGDPSGEVQVQNVNGNDRTDTSSIGVDYDSGGEGRVLLVGASSLKSDENSSEIRSAQLENGRELREVETALNEDYNTKVFMLKNPPEGGTVRLNSENATHMSAITVTLSGAAMGVTLGDVKSRSSNQSTVSTEVENEDGEMIVDFVSSSRDLSTDDDNIEDMSDVDLGNEGASLYSFRNGAEGIQEMKYKDGKNYTQIALNIERDTTDAEYLIEQDEENIGNNGNPDEYATAFSMFFNNSYRSTVASFGFESIKSNRSRNELMEDTIRYLTGPVANQTSADAKDNSKLDYTEVDESKYTSERVNINAVGKNTFNPSTISEGRFFYNYSGLGMQPALDTDMEDSGKFLDNWSFNLDSGGDYAFTGECGTKYGSKALRLDGKPDENDGSWGTESADDVAGIESNNLDLSEVSNVTLSFWAKAPENNPGSSCDGPEEGSTFPVIQNYLEIGVRSSSSEDYARAYLAPSSYRGGWYRAEFEIGADYLSENTQFMIRRVSNDQDAWLIDDISVHQGVFAEDGDYDSDMESASVSSVNLTRMTADLDSKPTGYNVTVATQFKDNSKQGYWGQKEKTWVKIDTQPPDIPEGTTELETDREYTNNQVVNVTYSNQIGSQYRAEYIRFSCDSSSGEWSRWKDLDRNQETEKLSFDITDTGSGCTENQGNRTVYAQVRDYAGNKPSRIMEDWVIYETEPPIFEGETPQNGSAIQSTGEIKVDASDNYQLNTAKARYFNGSENISFTPNQSFNPDFSSEGLKEGIVYLFDKASNLRKVPLFYYVDDTPPSSNVTPQNSETPANDTVVNSDMSMVVNISDESFDRVKINYGRGNTTYNRKDINLTPEWGEGASQDFVLWMKDEAGNKRKSNYTYDVDDTPPVNDGVKVENNSYILNSTKLGYNFTDPITRLVGTSVSENKVGLKGYDLGVETGWTTEGEHSLQVNATDVINKRTLNFTYIVDETPPEAEIYYENYNGGDWASTDVSLAINATDNMNMSRIQYCKQNKGGSCSLDSKSEPDKNITETVTCSEGETCEKVILYNAKDSAGNKISSNPLRSSEIKIDKERPQISDLRPTGRTVSGNITVSAEITDEGSGVDSTDITVYNLSDSSQVYATGTLSDSEGNRKAYRWDSEADIPEAGEVMVEISASDSLGQEASIQGSFMVDNQRANVQIENPFQRVVGEDFRLNLTAVRPGTEDITSHNYSIEDGTTEVYSNKTTSIGSESHSYDLIFDTDLIDDDGNYTLNTSAFGGSDEFATEETWFYLDREEPKALITSDLNNTWQEGELTVDYIAGDKVRNGTLRYEYRDDRGSWESSSLDYGEDSFSFETGTHCDDDAESDCEIKIVAEDAAGNINTSKVSFKVDNSEPSVSIDSPSGFSWQKGDFSVERTIKDETAENSDQGLSCSYRIKSESYREGSFCNGSINVDIPSDCNNQDEECSVSVKAINPAGLENTADRTFRVDTNAPEVTDSYPRPENESIINGDESITYYFQEDFSGITYSLLDDGYNREGISEGEPYEPRWVESGEKTLDLELNDTAGNFKEETYEYIFDNEKPELDSASVNKPYDAVYDEVRVYGGQSMKLNVSVKENIEMDRVLLRLNETGTLNEYSLNAPEDSEAGNWTVDLPSRESGYYNFTELKLVDKAGNTQLNSSLKGYRVVNYSQTVKIGENTEITASQRQDFNLTVDFNRTVGERSLDLYVPPSTPASTDEPYYTITNTQCTVSSCNVSSTPNKLEINYTGGKDEIKLTGDIHANTEGSDRDKAFTSLMAGNERKSSAVLRTPELTVGNISCGSCEFNQFENFTLNADALNNNTDLSTGEAFNVTMKISSNSSENPIKKAKNIGDISTGENISEAFENLSFDRAGTYKINTGIKDRTGSYSDTASITVKVLDITKPEINNTEVSSTRVNVNGSVTLEADITDNKAVESANITVQVPNGTEITSNMSRARSDRFISVFENTSVQGDYDIVRIKAVDPSGNEKIIEPNKSFKVTQLRFDANVSETSISNDEAVNFSLNITGNSSDISSVEINSTTPEESYIVETYESVKKVDNLTFDRFRNSGNYSFNVTVNSDFSVTNQTEDVFVQYGDSSVEALSGQNGTVLLPKGSDLELPWNISTENGGLKGTLLEFSSDDRNKLDAPRSIEDIGNITAVEGHRIEGFTVSPENTGNATIQIAASPENGSESSENLKVMVRESDQTPPNITSYSISDQILNLGENQTFKAEIEELSVIENVTVEIENNETGETWKRKMSRNSREQFYHEFTGSEQVGFYNYTIKAYDVSGNSISEQGNYSVSDQYQIEVSRNKEIYVKGDNPQFDIEVQDMNGEEVENYDSKVTLDKGSEDEEIATGSVEQASADILVSDPPAPSTSANNLPMDYELRVNVTKGENSGIYTENVDVTRRLRIREFDTVEEFIPEGGNFTVKGRWVEPGGYTVDGKSASFVTCQGCEQRFKSFSTINSSTTMRKQTFNVPNGTDSVLVQAVVSNAYGNSESQISNDPAPALDIDIGGQGTATNNTGNSGLPSGGLSGGGDGGPSMEITRLSPDVGVPPTQSEINLSVNTNIAADCAYSRNAIPESVSFEEASSFEKTGGVMHTSMLNLEESMTYSYSIMCSSDAANSTTDIIFSKGERELSAFQPSFPETLTPGNDSITQDSNGSGLFTVYNNQSEALDLQFEVESDCCNGTVVENGREVTSTSVSPGEEKGLSLSMYAPLYVEEGVHSATLTIIGENATRQRQISFDVGNNEQVDRFEELSQRAGLLNSSISRYRIAGIDTSRMRKGFGNLTVHLGEANNSIQANDIQGLETALEKGEQDADRVDQMLEDASFKKFVLLNWWKWALGFVIAYIMFFLVVMVGIPYYRIKTELTRVNSQLESATEARKKGEKQYFQRKIDKDTFNQMMTERQNEVLELRGEKEDLKEELDGFLRSQLTLENYIKAPSKGLDELGKWWAANKKARENLKGKEDEGSE